MHPRLDLEFIQSCCEGLQAEKWENREFIRRRVNKWNNDNREKCRESVRRYSKSEKAKSYRKQRNKLIRESLKKMYYGERMLIKNFYSNTPKGYEVDHIIPLSKGGQHVLSNLQYLTKKQNSSKGTKEKYNLDYA